MDVITTHINADFDCLGAMVAAKKLYPRAELVFAGAQERSLREFFLKSASYAYAFRRLKDIDLEAVTRLILVDVRQADRIGPFAEVASKPGVEIHIYDHHPGGEGNLKGDIEVIEPVGASVTVLAHLFMQRGIHPTPDEATIMMLGLYEDTGSLMFSSTTPSDYQAAGFLLEHGANLNAVADFLTYEMTPDQVALLHELIDTRFVLNVHGFDVSIAHGSVGHFIGDLAMLTHKLRDMEGLDALVVAVRMGDRIFLVGRSRLSEVHVGEILSEFGGGGHAFAASATVREQTLVQVLDRLAEVLKNHVNPRLEARHLMSFPVKTVGADATISEVRQLLTRYNINAVPVVEGEDVHGIVTRQIVEKAAHHGLKQVRAAEYMQGEFATASPDSPVDELKKLIVEHNQRFVPVLEQGRLVGAITRTDLLRYLVARGPRPSGSRDAGGEESSAEIKPREIRRLIRDNLPGEVQELLHAMGDTAEELGVPVFAVGGFVRDLLLQQKNLDLDVVVEGDGIAFAAAFAKQRGGRIRSHEKFRTAVIVLPDERKIDVASARMEYYLEPGALPTVENASLKLDLYRRDFTINTMAVVLNPSRFGELIDFFGGLRDLREKALRVLHNLSFVEDPTRVFRGVRFEQRLGFHVGRQTEHLIQSAVRMGFLEKIGGPRTFQELQLILQEEKPFRAIYRMEQLDLLRFIHPGLKLRDETERIFRQAGRSLNWHELLYREEQARGWRVYFLCLCTFLDQDAMEGICTRLAIAPRQRELFSEQRARAHAVLQSMERRRARGHREPAASTIHGWLHDFPIEILLYLMARTSHDEVRAWISTYVTQLRDESPQLNGEDLKELGIAPGPVYKEIFSALLKARLDGRVLTRADEVEFVRRRYRNLLESDAGSE